jgi:hypothetical protein
VSDRILAELERVPRYERFLGVDELLAAVRGAAARHPELARLRDVGRSSDGEPIPVLTIDGGPRSALLVGCPHPNEPIGAMLVRFLTDALIERPDLRRGWTWHLIPCVDPDGTRLNEGWFRGPFTLRNYARHFYRPWSEEQVEWTFPVRYEQFAWTAPLPETRALMRAFEETRPDFVYSLHNSGFGGVYYYLSEPLAAGYEALHRIPRALGLVLSLGEPEMPWAVEWAPAVYRYPSVRDAYDYHARYAPDAPAARIAGGGSSLDYLLSIRGADRAPMMLIAELPYFQSPEISDRTPVAESKREVILHGIERTRAMLDILSRILADVSGTVAPDTRLMRAFSSFIRHQINTLDSKYRWAHEADGMGRPATVAERVDAWYIRTFYRVLMASMLGRALGASISRQPSPAAARAQARLTRWLDTWLTDVEAHVRYEVTPIRTLVQAQYGAMLAVLEQTA